MPTLGIKPLFLSESKLTVGLDDYGAHISGAQFVPSSSTVTWKGLKPGSSFSQQTSATWALTLNYAQDWESAASLSQYLLAHEGETIDIELEPVDGGPSFMASVTITPGAIGGEVDTFGTTSVTLGVLGKPELIPAA